MKNDFEEYMSTLQQSDPANRQQNPISYPSPAIDLDPTPVPVAKTETGAPPHKVSQAQYFEAVAAQNAPSQYAADVSVDPVSSPQYQPYPDPIQKKRHNVVRGILIAFGALIVIAMIAAVISLGIGLIGGALEDDYEFNDDTNITSLCSGKFSLDGKDYVLGKTTWKDIVADGWSFDEYIVPVNTVAAETAVTFTIDRGGTDEYAVVSITLLNKTTSPIDISQAVLEEITVTGTGIEITLPENVRNGMSNAEVKEIYGTPSYISNDTYGEYMAYDGYDSDSHINTHEYEATFSQDKDSSTANIISYSYDEYQNYATASVTWKDVE